MQVMEAGALELKSLTLTLLVMWSGVVVRGVLFQKGHEDVCVLESKIPRCVFKEKSWCIVLR